MALRITPSFTPRRLSLVDADNNCQGTTSWPQGLRSRTKILRHRHIKLGITFEATIVTSFQRGPNHSEPLLLHFGDEHVMNAWRISEKRCLELSEELRGWGEAVCFSPFSILLSSRRSFIRHTVWRTPLQTDQTTDRNVTRRYAELAVGSILIR